MTGRLPDVAAATPGLGARQAAARALLRVHRDGAYLNLALRGILERAGLGPRESALATALAAGVLRWQSRLDFALARCSRRPLSRIDPPLLELLRIAAFEVGFSRTVPAPVACDLAVRAARQLHPGAAAFANAVLRALVREAAGGFPAPDDGPLDQRLAVTYSHPRWLVRRWLARLGPDETRALLEANNQPPPACVRVNRLRTGAAALLERWAAAGVQGSRGGLLPEDALLVHELPAPLQALPGYREGLFTPQSEPAMVPARALEPVADQRLVDLAAAPGGKTTQLAELAGDRLHLVAVDRHAGRLGRVVDNARRLGLSSIRAVAADGGRPPLPEGWADGVLVDAPCSDLGVVARRPDVRYHRREEDLPGLVALQRRLLEGAVGLLRPGGRLVYSVCSFEPEETVDQVRWLLERWPELELEALPDELPGAAGLERQDAAWLLILPHRHRTDGFFVARLRRRVRV